MNKALPRDCQVSNDTRMISHSSTINEFETSRLNYLLAKARAGCGGREAHWLGRGRGHPRHSGVDGRGNVARRGHQPPRRLLIDPAIGQNIFQQPNKS